KFPIWYRNPPPDLMAGTPMCTALNYCYQVIGGWCAARPSSFPPIVLHLTDGESGAGEPGPAATRPQALYPHDGHLLLFNCHLSDSTATPVLFPTREADLPDQFSRTLFRMSSTLPERMLQLAAEKNLSAPRGARGMAFNADGVSMLQLINVGTIIARSS